MNNFKKNTLLLILSTFSIFSLSASYRLVLQSGHDGIPVAVQWHEKSKTIVSAGIDGRLIVTRPGDNKVLHRFRVTDENIYDLKVDPVNSRAAVITSKNGIYTVSVWNWNDEEIEYDYELESEPLFTSWSARGRYLTIGNLGSPSIIVLEGRTGRRLSYLQRLPSLYNTGYIGSTETILMTYMVSGAIRYWDIRSSVLKLSTETISNLQGIRVLQTESKTTLFGYRNETLFLVNRQTGVVLDQIEIPGLKDVSIDKEDGEIDALAENMAGSFLHQYKVRNERFLPRDFGTANLSTTAEPLTLDVSIQAMKVLRRNGTTYLMSESGSLYSQGLTGFSPLINDRLWQPDSMAFHDESIYISGGSKILRFTSPFFKENSNGDTQDLSTVTREEINTDSRSSDTGIRILEDGTILLWDKGNDDIGSGIRRLRFSSPEYVTLFPVDGKLQKLDIIDDERMLSVDRNGTVKIMSSFTGEIFSTYSALGILDSAYSIDGGYLLAGRSSTGRAGSALEQVDTQTRESVPVPDNRFMIYRVETGPNGIYTIGVTRSPAGGSKTSILLHDKENPEQSKKILEFTGEDLNAVILSEPSGKSIFTTAGGEVLKINGSRRISFQWDESVFDLALRADVLYGLDNDGAMVLWDADNGRSLLKVYFFNDGGWIAIRPDNEKIWSSPGAIENVIIYRDGRVIDPRRISQILDDSQFS